jgi:hypothetical protein
VDNNPPKNIQKNLFVIPMKQRTGKVFSLLAVKHAVGIGFSV